FADSLTRYDQPVGRVVGGDIGAGRKIRDDARIDRIEREPHRDITHVEVDAAAPKSKRAHGLHVALDDDFGKGVEAHNGLLLKAYQLALCLVHRGLQLHARWIHHAHEGLAWRELVAHFDLVHLTAAVGTLHHHHAIHG